VETFPCGAQNIAPQIFECQSKAAAAAVCPGRNALWHMAWFMLRCRLTSNFKECYIALALWKGFQLSGIMQSSLLASVVSHRQFARSAEYFIDNFLHYP
jgi:hypothetical protein